MADRLLQVATRLALRGVDNNISLSQGVIMIFIPLTFCLMLGGFIIVIK